MKKYLIAILCLTLLSSLKAGLYPVILTRDLAKGLKIPDKELKDALPLTKVDAADARNGEVCVVKRGAGNFSICQIEELKNADGESEKVAVFFNKDGKLFERRNLDNLFKFDGLPLNFVYAHDFTDRRGFPLSDGWNYVISIGGLEKILKDLNKSQLEQLGFKFDVENKTLDFVVFPQDDVFKVGQLVDGGANETCTIRYYQSKWNDIELVEGDGFKEELKIPCSDLGKMPFDVKYLGANVFDYAFRFDPNDVAKDLLWASSRRS